jgi:UDPglucose 6-dehydrogenase
MTITVVGHGYVGLVTACVFADYGNKVWVIGHTPEKLEMLKNGDPIIYEPGLQELLQKNNKAGRLHFTTDYEQAVPESSIVFITVGTPPKENGEADLSTVFHVTEAVAKNLKRGYTVVSCKSTVPVGTNRKVAEIVEKNKPEGAEFDIASCPEFLREGTALQDTFHPDRIVIGTDNEKAKNALLEVHKPIDGVRVLVGIESAEIIKYASNSILATKISFANLISFICEQTGADVEQVLEGVGLDNRIGRKFLYSGVGYGGSCFPKDVRALTSTGKALGVDVTLLESVETINQFARENLFRKVQDNIKEGTVTLWGLAFKPDTDDIRFAPSVYLIEELLKAGYTVRAHDREAMDNIKKIFQDKIQYYDDQFEALEGSEALIILTEWNEFKQADLQKVKSLLRRPLIIDGRNIYEVSEMKKLGFEYISTGRVPVK